MRCRVDLCLIVNEARKKNTIIHHPCTYNVQFLTITYAINFVVAHCMLSANLSVQIAPRQSGVVCR